MELGVRMIGYADGVFKLSTHGSSYWFRVTGFGHLEHLYYGAPLRDDQPIEPLGLKRTAYIGSSILYDRSDGTYSLDNMCLEWSGIGKGDYRNTPAEIKMPDGTYTADFRYQSHQIVGGSKSMEAMPSSYGGADDCDTLEIAMLDESNNVTLLLYYTVYRAADVITRRTVLVNGGDKPLSVRKLMSMSVDLPNDSFRLITFDGGWIREGVKHERALSYGIHVNSSTTGDSSNRHNPGFMLAAQGATQTGGDVYGFNLVYSGNHYGAVELSSHDIARVQIGINPYCFEWELPPGEGFETPEALLCYSGEGFNGLSHSFHDFINRHIVRGDWKGRERPIVMNNWEAHFFRFTRRKLLRLARRAKKAGIEMFVLDDGWFSGRDNDRAGLGDYSVNRKKLPRGLSEFSSRIHKMGMKFGLWFEPEMVNEDSDLYRAHPEYALRTPGKRPATGRNQLVLDMCDPRVRGYIVDNVTRILDTCGIDYVKWDYNMHISDACSPALENQGRFFHSYILGLYEVLDRIFTTRPHILFESCSSGGNRFDLGMMCFSPQVWASDDTDPIERLKIQGGLSYLYPLSTMGAHVSEAPHQQTLRDTPLATRFNAAVFGCLGYEMDLKYLSRMEFKEVQDQIAFYKRHRRTLQYGTFWRGEPQKDNKVAWHCVAKPVPASSMEGSAAVSVTASKSTATSGEAIASASASCIAGFFQTQAAASEGFDRLRIEGLDPGRKYSIRTRPQRLYIKRFGGLVKHILPIPLNPEGFLLRLVNKFYSLTDCVEEYAAYGETLASGIMLNNQFTGSNYNKDTRLLGDFGSYLYVVESIDGGA